jgi:iron complex transport system substrate-binding protein
MRSQGGLGSVRRGAWRGALFTVATVFAVTAMSCSSSEEPSSTGGSDGSSLAAEGPWTYTDGLGETVELDATPERIVAYEESAAYLMSFGIRPVGVFGSAPIDQNSYFEDLDMTGVESLGEVYGEVNAEKTAAVRPSLIVSTFYGGPPVWGFTNDNQLAKFDQIAPVVAIDRDQSPGEILETYGKLAESLGADLGSPEIMQSKERYEAALDDLQAAAESNPGISVLGISAGEDGMYVAGTTTHPDLFDYEAVGMKAAGPEKGSKDNVYVWETLSWENADTYPADVIIFDARPGNYVLEDLLGVPSFAALPAAKAGQVVPWHVGSNTSWDRYAEHTEELASVIANAQDVA